MTDDTIPLDKLARIYVKMRTAIQDLDKQIETIKAQQQDVKNAMKDQNPDLHPPGLSSTSEFDISVTKPR
jgi:hypothetical protein